MFACAHPAIDPAIRAPLILQTVLGFDAAAIASAFLVSPTTMAQRLVRAKIAHPGGWHPLPRAGTQRTRRAARCRAGGHLRRLRRRLDRSCWRREAPTQPRRRGIWLGRLMVSLMPDEPETFGLLALMLYAEARRPARRNAAGDYVPLAEQDVSLWDSALIDEAEALLTPRQCLRRTRPLSAEAAVQSAHCAAVPAAPTGRRSGSSTMRCGAVSPRRSWHQPGDRHRRDGRAGGWPGRIRRLAGDRRLESINPIGPRGQICWPGSGAPSRLPLPMTALSGWKAMLPCGGFEQRRDRIAVQLH